MNKETDLEFIKLVQSYPILYDREQSRGQKNSNMKNEAWQEIAQIIKKSEIACITRWKSIRDRFGKEYRRQQENSQDTTNWELFPHLLFLKDHYKQGSARNDAIESIKYAPRVRKTKPKREYANNDVEEEIKPEELALNQNIIALVKQHDVLYDSKRVRDSKNLAAKNEAWTTIANTLDVTEQVCYTKWKKLRDRFSREYRQLQLHPERPITWIYFNDLKFLQNHYRRGIPLPVDEIRSKTKLSPVYNENPWGDDLNKSFGYSDSADQQNDDQDSSDHLIAEETTVMNDLDELLYIAPKKQCLSDTRNDSPIQVSYHVSHDMTTTNPVTSTSYTNTTTNASIYPTSFSETSAVNSSPSEAEQKLQNVISNMECVLQQSQDCLKAVQQQKETFKQEILQKSNSINLQTEMLQKVNVLLDGLQPEQRNKAERKILQFLCECQIKILNNEEINDVKPVNIY
ncbi:transcription factor Adf-1 [Calliphora vicina]|uniref:transcription factor Adf-1 n=1 Tax=Calliphora vicina TaxID=7373 RepID=UPI00325A8A29